MPKPGVFLSLNLTQGTSQEVDAGHFARPLFLDGNLIVAEVVFWGAKVQRWIVLVSDRTNRSFPEGVLEVATSELSSYEVLGVEAPVHAQMAAADAAGHARKFRDRDMFLVHFESARLPKSKEQLAFCIEQMDALIARNQNAPPAGEADGSFTVEQWTAARDALKALREAHRAYGNLL